MALDLSHTYPVLLLGMFFVLTRQQVIVPPVFYNVQITKRNSMEPTACATSTAWRISQVGGVEFRFVPGPWRKKRRLLVRG